VNAFLKRINYYSQRNFSSIFYTPSFEECEVDLDNLTLGELEKDSFEETLLMFAQKSQLYVFVPGLNQNTKF
jgi:hypothetical protein